MKIGLFFGSFNPIHIGHLNIAHLLVESEKLDQVHFVISPQNPFKEKKDLLDEQLRLELVELAIKGETTLSSSDVEFKLPQPSYTYDTLTLLKESNPTIKHYIILGSDNLAKLHTWKNGEQLIDENKFLVYPRLGYNKATYIDHPNFRFCDLPIIEVSSTDIRNRVAKDLPFRFLVDKSTYNLIKAEKYYQK